MVDEPGIQLIKGIHEGAVVAMADGYARASGKLGMVIVANIGLPNAMTQMVNSWKDQIPVLVAAASVEQETLGRDLMQETDYVETMTSPITKWHWSAKTTTAIPETLQARSSSPPPPADRSISRSHRHPADGRDGCGLRQDQIRRQCHPSRQG